MVLEPLDVQVAHVAELAREQLDFEVGEPQGEEIGRHGAFPQRGRLGKAFQGSGQDLLAALQLADEPGPGALGPIHPVGRQRILGALRNHYEALGGVLGRVVRAGPPRHTGRQGQEGRVVERGPGCQQLLGLPPVPVQRQVLKALAGQEDDQVFESHTLTGTCGSGRDRLARSDLKCVAYRCGGPGRMAKVAGRAVRPDTRAKPAAARGNPPYLLGRAKSRRPGRAGRPALEGRTDCNESPWSGVVLWGAPRQRQGKPD